MRLISILILGFFVSMNSIAGQTTIEGKVVDSNGNGVGNAYLDFSIPWRTDRSTRTSNENADRGDFTIYTPNSRGLLTVSIAGYSDIGINFVDDIPQREIKVVFHLDTAEAGDNYTFYTSARYLQEDVDHVYEIKIKKGNKEDKAKVDVYLSDAGIQEFEKIKKGGN